MMKKRNFIIYFLLIILSLTITNCGFKVIDKSNLNYDIAEITTTGEKRINFKIKNKLLFNSSKNDKRLLNIDIHSKKIKNVKEKNIKNEITKYELEIIAIVTFSKLNSSEKNKFNIQVSGDYDVANQFSQTLTNEKKLIETLTEKIAEKINDNLIFRLNDI
tara:strand:- start:742 stop:1224 length:483 start_codon:yes stop_codon:yes gene_type:complete